MSNTTYRYLKAQGRFNVFANPADVSNTLSTAVTQFVPRGLDVGVTNFELVINKQKIITDDCDPCRKSKITEAARLNLSGLTSDPSSVRDLIAQLNVYVNSDEFTTNWSGFQTNSGTVVVIDTASV